MPEDLGLSPAAAIRAFSFGTPGPATAPAAPAPPTAPTVTPAPSPPVGPQGEVTQAETARMIEWEKENLAQGTITPEEAAKRFDALGATPEQRALDTRSDEVKQLDKDFPPAKESDYIIQYYTPGQAPAVLPKEVQAFDASARKWMTAMGLSCEQGNNVATILSKTFQQLLPLSANEREAHKDAENAKLEKILGDTWEDALRPVQRMIAEVNALHPGFTEFVREHGDNALLIMELTKASRIYDKRKGR